MPFLGIDLGSSSIKASLVDPDTGRLIADAQYPSDQELPILSPHPGWAEQDPDSWIEAAAQATRLALAKANHCGKDVRAIGISYQMHGLVCLDKAQQPLRPSIIWCDSRAVDVGRQAAESLGAEACLDTMLNTPGNFTASKLRWVADNEPDLYSRIDKICLPGDYLAAFLTGEVRTTLSGLSEGTLWDFAQHDLAHALLSHYAIRPELIAEQVPTFGTQGELTSAAAERFGLGVRTPVTYRAGDQPNNALSLGALHPGDVAATAGTSGVVYGVSDQPKPDKRQRVNTFAHVNHTQSDPRLGVLLCVNGTGIAYAWLRRFLSSQISYPELNAMAASVPAGAEGLLFLPFGNGAERLLNNESPGGQLVRLDFNRHSTAHVARAVQEGIAFAFDLGLEGMHDVGVQPRTLRAGSANLMQSALFRQTLCNLSGASITLYETDGAAGAARAAGIGLGHYASPEEALSQLQVINCTQPETDTSGLAQARTAWREALDRSLSS